MLKTLLVIMAVAIALCQSIGVPMITALGASVLCIVCLGAFVAHLPILHGDLIHTLIPAFLLGMPGRIAARFSADVPSCARSTAST